MDAHKWLSPFTCLRDVWVSELREHRSNNIRHALASALIKDAEALIESRPHSGPEALSDPSHRETLRELIKKTHVFLRTDIIDAARRILQGVNKRSAHAVFLVSPFAGGSLPGDTNAPNDPQDETQETRQQLRIGCLNPGNSGLSALNDYTVLWRKLSAI